MLFGCLLHGTRAASPRDRRARRGRRFRSSRGAAPACIMVCRCGSVSEHDSAAFGGRTIRSACVVAKTSEWPEFTTEIFEQWTTQHAVTDARACATAGLWSARFTASGRNMHDAICPGMCTDNWDYQCMASLIHLCDCPWYSVSEDPSASHGAW